MPPSSASTADRIRNYTVVAAKALQDVAEATGIPFVARVCALTLEIVPLVQQVQKERCLQIMDLIQHLLCALMDHSIYSEEIQSPGMLERITECTVTLQKIDSFLRAQQDLGVIKQMFKKSEITAQLQCCEIKLKDALSNFTINQGSGLALALMEFNIDSEERHQEFLELMSSQSGSFDGLSSLGNWTKFLEYQLRLILVTPRVVKNIPRA
ncbi:hypothetical protein K438DRAFT_1962333 [Mycena galopus ATCC 62051]|nr:hypothetical protein K438DRAFT_1962333 [Mycena galopus ATCC 62051]